VNVEKTITTWAYRHADCFAQVPDCGHSPLKHTPFLIAIEKVDPISVDDKLGNETVCRGHEVMLPWNSSCVNKYQPEGWRLIQCFDDEL